MSNRSGNQIFDIAPEKIHLRTSEFETKRSKNSKTSNIPSIKNSKETSSIVGGFSAEKPRRKTPSKRSVQFSMRNSSNKKSKDNLGIGYSGKKHSRYEFPDFTIDSPKTNVNTDSKLLMEGDNYTSESRKFHHVQLEDVLGARSLPISLMDEEIESNLGS